IASSASFSIESSNAAPAGTSGKALGASNPIATVSSRFRVIEHALEIHDHRLLVADDPGVVAGGEERDVAGFAVEFGAVVHFDADDAGDVILEVRRLAALCLGDRLHGGRPP